MVRIRRRGVGLVGGAILLFLAGTNIQSGWLFVLSSLLLGAAVSGTLVPLFMVRGLTVERRGPAEAFVGDTVPVDLVVTGRSRGAWLSVTVRDPLVAPTAVFVPHVCAGEAVVARTERRATRRGVTKAGAVEVASTAPFGMAEARRVVPCPGETVILPRVVPLRQVRFLEAGLSSGDEAASGGRRGEGNEYAGVREYRQGDSMRRVHWPATARHGSLVVRETERERPASLTVVVDAWADAGEEGEETLLDLCCTVAGSVAVAAIEGGHDVFMVAGREAGPPATAGTGRREALHWLAGLQPTGGPPFPEVLEEMSGGRAGPGSYLLVAPTWRHNRAPALAPSVASLAASGARVMAAMVDAQPFRPRAPVLGPAELEELERTLQSEGADVCRIEAPVDVERLGLRRR